MGRTWIKGCLEAADWTAFRIGHWRLCCGYTSTADCITSPRFHDLPDRSRNFPKISATVQANLRTVGGGSIWMCWLGRKGFPAVPVFYNTVASRKGPWCWMWREDPSNGSEVCALCVPDGQRFFPPYQSRASIREKAVVGRLAKAVESRHPKVILDYPRRQRMRTWLRA